jgi:carboxyl-terminal processing protease
MTIGKNRRFNLWLVMIVAVITWTISSGLYQELSAKGGDVYKGLKTFTDVLEIIEKNYVDPVETSDLIEKAIQGMVQGLDPHSSLLPPDAFEDLKIDTKGEFTGIGISITLRDGFITVISPIEGTPAYRAGIKAWDRIIEVDGVSTRDLREAVKMMRGPKGTKVKVTIIREGTPKPIDFDLVRDVIPIESVRALTLKPGYGYVWVTHFRDQTATDLEKALDELASETPLKGLVLDLRDNPGGLLPQSIKVSDLFLEDGIILSIKGRLKQHTKIYNAHSSTRPRDYPIIVLINGGSASAAEIVAGALQDNKRALIMGSTSFGKGSVQTVENLRDGYGLKLTIARYYTPSGRSIQAKGIEPDLFVKQRIITKEEREFPADNRMHEKDLKNHLNAEPGAGKDADAAKTDTDAAKTDDDGEKDIIKKNEKDQQDSQEPMPRLGPLSLERLESDYQVMHALEILRGYELLSRTGS